MRLTRTNKSVVDADQEQKASFLNAFFSCGQRGRSKFNAVKADLLLIYLQFEINTADLLGFDVLFLKTSQSESE